MANPVAHAPDPVRPQEPLCGGAMLGDLIVAPTNRNLANCPSCKRVAAHIPLDGLDFAVQPPLDDDPNALEFRMFIANILTRAASVSSTAAAMQPFIYSTDIPISVRHAHIRSRLQGLKLSIDQLNATSLHE